MNNPPTVPILRLQTPPSKDEFVESYLTPGIPVIIEGAFTSWEANNWTLDYLKNKSGDATVHVRKNTQSEDYRLGRKYDVVQMKFSSYIDRILATDPEKLKKKRLKKKSKSGSDAVESSAIGTASTKCKSSSDSIDNFYLAVQNLKRVLPELCPDIEPLPEYIGKIHQGPFLWIAPDEHYEYTHFDPDDGMLFVIKGQKKVRLFHWNLIENLYPNPLGSKGRTIQATVDTDNPDLKKHPLFENATCEEGILNDGDLLFIPAFYWHQVTSAPHTISINAFFGDAGDTQFAKKVFNSRYDAVLYWVLNIIEQNRLAETSIVPILANLENAMSEFFFKQWHERLSDEHLQKICTRILQHCGYQDGPPKYDGPTKKHFQLKIRGLLWRN